MRLAASRTTSSNNWGVICWALLELTKATNVSKVVNLRGRDCWRRNWANSDTAFSRIGPIGYSNEKGGVDWDVVIIFHGGGGGSWRRRRSRNRRRRCCSSISNTGGGGGGGSSSSSKVVVIIVMVKAIV